MPPARNGQAIRPRSSSSRPNRRARFADVVVVVGKVKVKARMKVMAKVKVKVKLNVKANMKVKMKENNHVCVFFHDDDDGKVLLG